MDKRTPHGRLQLTKLVMVRDIRRGQKPGSDGNFPAAYETLVTVDGDLPGASNVALHNHLPLELL